MNWKKNLAFVWTSQFLSTVGFSFTTSFIPFYMQMLGVNDPKRLNMYVALFTAAGYFSFCFFAPIWGFLSDIYGRRLMMLRANFACAVCVFLMAYVPSVGWLVFIRFLVGIFSGTVTASQVLISANTPCERRGFALGVMSSAVYSGTMGGTLLGGVIVDCFGYRAAFLSSAATLTLAGLLTLFGVEERFRKTTDLSKKIGQFKFKSPAFGWVWLILLLVLMMGFCRRFVEPFLPLLVEEVNGPVNVATWTGVIGSLSALAGIISGVLLGWLADRVSPPKMAMWSAAFAGLLLIPQGLAHSLPLLMSARFGMVFFAGGLDPIFQIWLSKSTPNNKHGLFLGWASSAKSFGWFLCSLSSGWLAMCWGVRWVFLAAALMFLALVPIIKIVIILLPIPPKKN